MSKSFCTADEIAWAICIAWRLNTSLHPHEVGKGPEWVVQRALSTPPGKKAACSRTAVYAYDALLALRPNCCREAIAMSIGFASGPAAAGAQGQARNSIWWDAAIARKLRRLLAQKIGDRHDPPPAPVAEKAQDNTPPEKVAPLDPAPRPEPVEARATAFVPRRASSLGARALQATELPYRSPFAKRRALTPAEQAMNAAMLGDPGATSLRIANDERSAS